MPNINYNSAEIIDYPVSNEELGIDDPFLADSDCLLKITFKKSKNFPIGYILRGYDTIKLGISTNFSSSVYVPLNVTDWFYFDNNYDQISTIIKYEYE